jgi:hypothetical protein
MSDTPYARVRRSTNNLDLSQYETDTSFREHASISFDNVRTTNEMVHLLRNRDDVELDARVMCVTKNGYGFKRMDRKSFIESYDAEPIVKLRESDAFATGDMQYGGNLLGDDFIPLLGGPFFKQLYLSDMLKQTQLAFHAYHHDPIANAAINIIVDFTLGRGFRVDHPDNKAMFLWESFEQANELQDKFHLLAKELSVYGETMVHWLPGNASHFTYNLSPGQKIPVGLIPRIILRDPSSCWEVVTYPEDITRVLTYVFSYPTQYSMYSAKDEGTRVPTTKFIYDHTPADQIMHFKVNTLSNEKRGRSDLYPVFGYLKRLRDAVNWEMIKAHKLSAWCTDITVDGNQADIDALVDQLGQQTIPNAGSEFIHSTKIKREYLGSEGGKGTPGGSFDWTLSMICAGIGIPQSYFGTHHNGGSTRASAIVATEPVAKKFEMRQQVYERIIKKIASKLFDHFGMSGAEKDLEITFPEVITQDRSAKLKDLALAETQRWISPERAAEIASKELNISEYDFEEEQAKIGDQKSLEPTTQDNPLSAEPEIDKTEKPSAVTSQERRKLSLTYGA